MPSIEKIIIRKGFKFRLMPTLDQSSKLRQFCGNTRYVYNRALAESIEAYQETGQGFSRKNESAKLPLWKRELDWLKASPSQSLQVAIKDLEQAYKKFWKGLSQFPTFHKKGKKESFSLPQNIKVDKINRKYSKIFIPKLGWVKFRDSREIKGRIKNATISIRANKFFVSFQTEIDHILPENNNPDIGVDVGITRLITLSNGQYFEPLNAFVTMQSKIAKLQKQLKNKKKFSKNWVKLQRRIAHLHNKVANKRNDYIHKLTTILAKKHRFIFVEDLDVKAMSDSKNSNKSKDLNKKILDQSWGMIKRLLEYKSELNAGKVVAQPPQYTSVKCLKCGHISKKNRTTQAKFCCTKCGFTTNADVVGAVNILRRGLKSLNLNFESGQGLPIEPVK